MSMIMSNDDANCHHVQDFKDAEFRARSGSVQSAHSTKSTHSSKSTQSTKSLSALGTIKSRKCSAVTSADNLALESNLRETTMLLTLGLRHRTEELLELAAPKRGDSMYHALFATILESLDDILSINKVSSSPNWARN